MQCVKMWAFGVVLQARKPLHRICPPKWFCIPSMGVFALRNAKKSGSLAWRSKRAYVCTKSARNNFFGYLAQGCLKFARPKNVGFRRGAPSTHTSAPIYAHQSVFGCLGWGYLHCAMRKNVGFRRGAPSVYLCTEFARKSVFGYLGWGCLHGTVPKNVGICHGAPSAHTSAPNMPAKVVLDT